MLKWVIFEPILLRKYFEKLRKEEAIYKIALIVFICVFILSVHTWIIAGLIVCWYDLPIIYPETFNKEILEIWDVGINWENKALFYLKYTFYDIRGSLDESFINSPFIYLIFSIFTGCIVSLTVSILSGLNTSRLTFGLIYSIVVSLIVGLIATFNYNFNLGLIYSLNVSIGIFFSFLFFYYRLYAYPLQLFKGILFEVNFQKNSYVENATIWFPLINVNQKLLRLAQKETNIAKKFIAFLLEYRPLQEGFAMHLTHATQAGEWKSFSKLQSDNIQLPQLIEKQEKYMPTKMVGIH